MQMTTIPLKQSFFRQDYYYYYFFYWGRLHQEIVITYLGVGLWPAPRSVQTTLLLFSVRPHQMALPTSPRHTTNAAEAFTRNPHPHWDQVFNVRQGGHELLQYCTLLVWVIENLYSSINELC